MDEAIPVVPPADSNLAARAPTRTPPTSVETLAKCNGNTPVEFVPDGKTQASHASSYERYAAYAKARTLREAVELGASGQDILFDYNKGFLKLIGAPKVMEPLPQHDLDRVDRLILKWRRTVEARGAQAVTTPLKKPRVEPSGEQCATEPATVSSSSKGAAPPKERTTGAKGAGANLNQFGRATVEKLAACKSTTAIEYVPDAKTAASHKGSYERYAQYSKAKTIGEALDLGAIPRDLLYDHMRGFLRIVGEPAPDGPELDVRVYRVTAAWKRMLAEGAADDSSAKAPGASAEDQGSAVTAGAAAVAADVGA